jgi:predicted nucleic acid-binding protein
MQPLLLQDTSVLINLLATGRFEEISRSTQWQFAICDAVRGEAKSIWNPDTQQRESIALAPLIQGGSLVVLDLDTDDERDAHVQLCSLPGVGPGEAMCMALAQSRQLEFATDDRKATRVCLAAQPAIRTVGTPDVLICWQNIVGLSEREMGELILRIEARARFSLIASHSHFAWWEAQRRAVAP